jgi:AraC-like DNA-binding protein
LRPIEIALSEFVIASLWEGAAIRSLGSARAVLFHRICQAIEAKLDDCELSLQGFADEQHASPRYIQKLFGEAGFSFSQYLRQRRLERCRADLSSRAHEALSISEICFRWGFNDAAHFSRSFHTQYGITPRGFRRTALDSSRSHSSSGVAARARVIGSADGTLGRMIPASPIVDN